MKQIVRIILAAAWLAAATAALAVEPFKIGLILPLSGPFASTGKQILTAANLYMQQKGDTVAGRKIELIVKDDGGLQPEVTKRLAQELAAQDKVNVLAGFGLTPLAFAAAPVATQAKIPMVVMAAATVSIPQRSPYVVRTARNMFQTTAPMADWAAKNKIKSVITLVSDYGPGIDAETIFTKRFTENGGKILANLRIPLQNPDFAPFLRRIKDARPDALFVMVPSGVGTAVMKQFIEKELGAAGIKLIGTGDVLDDDILPAMGSEAVGIVTTFDYSTAHDSPENKAYVAAFEKLAGLEVERLMLLDIAPTLAMYEATDRAFATAYFHWFFLIQPEPLPFRNGGTRSSMLAVQITRVSPNSTTTEPSACFV